MAGCGRTDADDTLAAAIASGKGIRECASLTGVSERTIARRKADPVFRAKVATIRGEMVARASGLFADGMTEAAGVLRDLLKSEDENVRHKSAVKVVELGLKIAEIEELQKRIEDLEQRIDKVQGV